MKWAAGAAAVLFCALVIGILGYRAANRQPMATAPAGSGLDTPSPPSETVTGYVSALSPTGAAPVEQLLLPGAAPTPSLMRPHLTTDLEALINARSNGVDIPHTGP
jgi:hypothetical protein